MLMSKRLASVAVGLILCAGLLNAATVIGVGQTTRERKAEGRQAARPALPPAEATITLNEQFMNSLLDAVFTNLRPPSFPLSLTDADPKQTKTQPETTDALASSKPVSQCASQVVLEREIGGVKTAVRFGNGRIVAPLAFTGTYNTGLLGCLRFQGWADTVINLEFNRERQTLNARVSVVDIHLQGVPQLANSVVVNMVQNAIDQRINPIEILQAAQLTTRLPISAAGGALRLRAKELRPEVIPGAVRLHIIYEFVRAD